VDHRAIGEDCFDFDDVVVGDAVLERVWAAGVFDDVAPDCGEMRRHGIRRETQPVRGELLLQGVVDDARLHAGGAGDGVDVENPVHCRQVDQRAVRVGHHRTSAVRRPAPGYQRNVMLTGDADNRDELVTRARA
jgi:hypothetical protein